MKQHQQSHAPPKFSCEYCGQKFSFRSGKLNHIRAMHKDRLAVSSEGRAVVMEDREGEEEER